MLPKRRVLEIYLNIAEWGPNGEFGAEAGARHAFGKSARDLTPQEAAELTAMLPNPVHRSARLPNLQLRKLAGLYERRAAAHPSSRLLHPGAGALAGDREGGPSSGAWGKVKCYGRHFQALTSLRSPDAGDGRRRTGHHR